MRAVLAGGGGEPAAGGPGCGPRGEQHAQPFGAWKAATSAGWRDRDGRREPGRVAGLVRTLAAEAPRDHRPRLIRACQLRRRAGVPARIEVPARLFPRAREEAVSRLVWACDGTTSCAKDSRSGGTQAQHPFLRRGRRPRGGVLSLGDRARRSPRRRRRVHRGRAAGLLPPPAAPSAAAGLLRAAAVPVLPAAAAPGVLRTAGAALVLRPAAGLSVLAVLTGLARRRRPPAALVRAD